MSKSKPRLSRGTRDFGPAVVSKRNYIINVIRQVYELYGFKPIETPAMEQLDTLMGKYGAEGDKLLFKIVNSGDFLDKSDEGAFGEKNSPRFLNSISEKGLRYDLTVPFARYVVMNQNEITFPFKRYQIQPVWRADRPQKGRYREFFQCDADVVGSNALMFESEFCKIIDEVFFMLGLSVTIRLNNRKILEGFADISGVEDRFAEMVVSLDKIDKIGKEKVGEELQALDIESSKADALLDLLLAKNSNEEKIAALETKFENSNIGQEGLSEIKEVLQMLPAEMKNQLVWDFSLARGLGYYTGTVFEVTANNTPMGSILGGGRYDNLTGIFGLPDVSGVGISFGLDRIYDVMEAEGKFPDSVLAGPKLVFINFDLEGQAASMKYAAAIRASGISCEVYPEAAKMKKQMKYVDQNNIPFAAMVGSQEIADETITLKNMAERTQETLKLEAVIDLLKTARKSHSKPCLWYGRRSA